jgi:hypothetical protein
MVLSAPEDGFAKGIGALVGKVLGWLVKPLGKPDGGVEIGAELRSSGLADPPKGDGAWGGAFSMLRRIEGGSRSRAGEAAGGGFSGNGAPKLATGRDVLGKLAEEFAWNPACGGGVGSDRLASGSFRLERLDEGSTGAPSTGWDSLAVACSIAPSAAGRLLGAAGSDAAIGARSGNPMTEGSEAVGSVVGGAASSCAELEGALLTVRFSVALGGFGSGVPRGVGMFVVGKLGGSIGGAVRAWFSNAGACSVDAARGLRNFDAPKGVGSDIGRGLLPAVDEGAGPCEGMVLGKFRRLLPVS